MTNDPQNAAQPGTRPLSGPWGYEYQTRRVRKRRVTGVCNGLGRAGWELVSRRWVSIGWVELTFRRRVQP